MNKIDVASVTILSSMALVCLCVGALVVLPGIPKFIQVGLGIVGIVLLPGLIWTYVIFPKTPLSPAERIGIGSVCSIAIIAVVAFSVNSFLRTPLSRPVLFFVVVCIAFLGSAMGLLFRRTSRPQKLFREKEEASL